MIQDKTIDETLIELMRCQRALEALRKAIKTSDATYDALKAKGMAYPCHPSVSKEHAAAKRASLDLTRKLADLRAGR